MALAYMDLKQEDEAIVCARALHSVSSCSAGNVPHARLALRRKKRYQEGEELCKKAVALDPSRPKHTLISPQMYNIRGASDQALQELKLALDGKSFADFSYYQQLSGRRVFETGRAYQAKQKPSEALRAYRTVLQLNPNEGRTHRQLAELYLRTGTIPVRTSTRRQRKNWEPRLTVAAGGDC